MPKELLRGRKAIMRALEISSLRVFYRLMGRLPVQRINGRLVAERNELIAAYLRRGDGGRDKKATQPA